jgi:two-component sensor histidine kinase
VKAELHGSEALRLASLRRYEILDTTPEADFDDIVQVVAMICKAPVCTISLVDEGRQWFKAKVGFNYTETPRDSSICAHAILQPGLFVVPDTTKDERFRDNPGVTGAPHVRFYAGAPLRTPEGLPLGTVCVLDTKPRDLDESQRALLRLMANQVMKLLELRRSNALEREARIKAEELVKENETLAREADHRIMNSLQLVSSVLSLQTRSASTEEAKAQLEGARNRVSAIATVHRQLHLAGSLEKIDIDDFLRRLCKSLEEAAPTSIQAIAVTADHVKIRSELASAIGLIVAELVTNSFKHAYPSGRKGSVAVKLSHNDKDWRLQVSDEGVGLPDGFDPTESKGVGMRIVTALVRRLDATLSVETRPAGAVFTIAPIAQDPQESPADDSQSP